MKAFDIVIYCKKKHVIISIDSDIARIATERVFNEDRINYCSFSYIVKVSELKPIKN
jgi:hypothetical protein